MKTPLPFKAGLFLLCMAPAIVHAANYDSLLTGEFNITDPDDITSVGIHVTDALTSTIKSTGGDIIVNRNEKKYSVISNDGSHLTVTPGAGRTLKVVNPLLGGLQSTNNSSWLIIEGNTDIDVYSNAVYADYEGNLELRGAYNKIKSSSKEGNGMGIHAEASSYIKVTGNADVEAALYGVACNNGSTIEMLGANTTVVTKGAPEGKISHAVISDNNSQVTFGGNVTVESEGVGVYSANTSALDFNGSKLDIHSSDTAVAATLGGIININSDLNAVSDQYEAVAASNGATVYLNGKTTTLKGTTETIRTSRAGSVYGDSIFHIEGDLATHSENNNGGMNTINLILQSGSTFEGAALADDLALSDITLDFRGNSTWTVTDDSTLKDLTLGNGSSLIFTETESGDFTNINAAMVMIEQGAILKLDTDGNNLSIGQELDLFEIANGGYFLDESGRMETVDGLWVIGYEVDENYNFTITSLDGPDPIPEPATVSVALIGLCGLLARRRRS